MPWLPNSDAQCDSCPRTYPGLQDRVKTVLGLRVAGWGTWAGYLRDGETWAEYIICPDCRQGQHRKARPKPTIEDTSLPGMENLHDDGNVKSQGIQSR